MILFAPHNAYHTETFANVLPELSHESLFVDVSARHKEGADRVIRERHLPAVRYSPWLLQKLKPEAIVVMNDWGGWPADLVRLGKRMNIPTVCHVEGVQDFTDSHIEHTGKGHYRHPYQHAEYPLLIGEYDRNFINSPNSVVVGSPRFDSLLAETPSFPDEPRVCINSNFTYQLYTDIQQSWLADCVGACEDLGFDYHITKHHADFGVPSHYRIYDGSMYDSIRDANLFISRFSTGILEALCLGKPAIYYNPHGERQDTFQDPRGAYPIARNRKELQQTIREVVSDPHAREAAQREFLEYHIGPLDGKAAQRFAQALAQIVRQNTGRQYTKASPTLRQLARYAHGYFKGFRSVHQ